MLRLPSQAVYQQIMSSSLTPRGKTVANAVAGFHPKGLDPELDFYIDGGVSVEWGNENIYIHIITEPDENDNIYLTCFTHTDSHDRVMFTNAYEAITHAKDRMPPL